MKKIYTWGLVLRVLRLYHGMSQNQLAKVLGVKTSYISNMENNRRGPSLAMLDKYSKLYNLPVFAMWAVYESDTLEETHPIYYYRLIDNFEQIYDLILYCKEAAKNEIE